MDLDADGVGPGGEQARCKLLGHLAEGFGEPALGGDGALELLVDQVADGLAGDEEGHRGSLRHATVALEDTEAGLVGAPRREERVAAAIGAVPVERRGRLAILGGLPDDKACLQLDDLKDPAVGFAAAREAEVEGGVDDGVIPSDDDGTTVAAAAARLSGAGAAERERERCVERGQRLSVDGDAGRLGGRSDLEEAGLGHLFCHRAGGFAGLDGRGADEVLGAGNAKIDHAGRAAGDVEEAALIGGQAAAGRERGDVELHEVEAGEDLAEVEAAFAVGVDIAAGVEEEAGRPDAELALLLASVAVGVAEDLAEQVALVEDGVEVDAELSAVAVRQRGGAVARAEDGLVLVDAAGLDGAADDHLILEFEFAAGGQIEGGLQAVGGLAAEVEEPFAGDAGLSGLDHAAIRAAERPVGAACYEPEASGRGVVQDTAALTERGRVGDIGVGPVDDAEGVGDDSADVGRYAVGPLREFDAAVGGVEREVVAGDRTLVAAPVEERVILARGVVEGGRVGAGNNLHGAAHHERLLDGREELGGEGGVGAGGRNVDAVEVALRRVEAVEAAAADALALLRGVAKQCRVDLATGEERVGLIVGVVEEDLLARSGCQGLGSVKDTHGRCGEAVDGGAAVGEVEVSVAEPSRAGGRAALCEDADAVGAGRYGAEVELAVRICDRAADNTRAAGARLEFRHITRQDFVAFTEEAIGLTGLVEESS